MYEKLTKSYSRDEGNLFFFYKVKVGWGCIDPMTRLRATCMFQYIYSMSLMDKNEI